MKADCHIHILLDGQNARRAIERHRAGPEEGWIRKILEIYQKAGYGYLRDGGDRWGVSRRARALAGEYGIRYRSPLAPLYAGGHYGGFIGRGFDSLSEFRQLLRENQENGADFLKIMVSGLMDFDHFGKLTEPGMEAALLKELCHIAREEGLAVMAHCNGARTAIFAAEAGVDSIEHGAYLNEEALQAMAEQQVIWVPTLSTIGNLLGKGRFSDKAVAQILESALENVRRFAALGGLLAEGSDAGAWAVPHGADTEKIWIKKALGADTDMILARGNQEIIRRF